MLERLGVHDGPLLDANDDDDDNDDGDDGDGDGDGDDGWRDQDVGKADAFTMGVSREKGSDRRLGKAAKALSDLPRVPCSRAWRAVPRVVLLGFVLDRQVKQMKTALSSFMARSQLFVCPQPPFSSQP